MKTGDQDRDWVAEAREERQAAEAALRGDVERLTSLASVAILMLTHDRDEARSQRDYAIEVKQNCDKIIADLMNQRDAAQQAAATYWEAWQDSIDGMHRDYPWLKEE